MNGVALTQAEQAARDLLATSTDAQLDDLVFRLGLPGEHVARGAPRATRSAQIWELAKNRGGTTLVELETLARDQQGRPQPQYFLYVSCSEEERRDPYLVRFYEDLSGRIRRLANLGGGEVRYLDEGNPTDPQTWSPWSLHAIQRARVLVCMQTRAFFASPYCGLVWAAFLERLKEYSNRTRRDAPLVFLVPWKPPSEVPGLLPLVARNLGPPAVTLPPPYVEQGLLALIRQADAGRDDARLDYERFIDDLATAIFGATAADVLPPFDIPPLDKIASVFHDPTQAGPALTPPGADYAKFVYVAATRSEMRTLRSIDAYDDRPEQWRPYHPLSQEALWHISIGAAMQTKMMAEALPVDREAAAKMQAADDNGNILVVLVDPWSVQLKPYGEFITQNCKFLLRSSTILVCWNDEDAETTTVRATLSLGFARLFNRPLERLPPGAVRAAIGSLPVLRTELIDALLAARRQTVDDTIAPKVAQGMSYVQPDTITAGTKARAMRDAAVQPATREGVVPFAQPQLRGPSGGIDR